MKKILSLLILVLIFLSQKINSQIVLNEVNNRNVSIIADEDGDYEDWIELYNAGTTVQNIQNYALSDEPTNLSKWLFPSINLNPNTHLLVFASGKNRAIMGSHWESAVLASNTWRYNIPTAEPPTTWRTIAYNDASLQQGPAGIGYGDNDDATIIPNNTLSVYLRKTFTVPNPAAVADAILSVDYDDGFVAYLNGTEIARSAGFGTVGTPPPYNSTAPDHEATVYQNGLPENFNISAATIASLLTTGTNVLAIQVHNTSAASSDLSIIPYLHFHIIDNSYNYSPTPNWFIPPNGTSAMLHTNFKINRTGETLYLSNNNQTIIDQQTINELNVNHSLGRNTDGATTWAIFTNPTPNTSNNTSTAYPAYEPAPTFSLAPGFYSGNQTITITNNAPIGGVIRYTIDGEEPTNTSPTYTAPLTSNTSKVLKAKCFSTVGNLPSATTTSMYFLNENFTVPVISITTDSANLVGADGIYDNWWTDWEKPCHIQYFDTAKVMQFQKNCAIKIDGGAGGSRSQPQKSFRITANNDLYGDGDIDYPMIPDKAHINTFSNFYLRNGSNFYMSLPYKEAFMQKVTKSTNNAYSAYTPVIVFLDGQYWGVYELREKMDEEYARNNYGADDTKTDVLSMSYFYGAGILRIVEGSDTGYYNSLNYITTANPANPNYYSNVDSKLDIKNYTDYTIAETWFGNIDWLYNNMKIIRSRATDNKWKFCLQDLELGLGSWVGADFDMIDFALNSNNPNSYSQILNALINNTQFKNYFINRYADLMNTTFLLSSTDPIGDEIYTQIVPEMPRNYNRWLTNVPNEIDDLMTNLANNHESMNNFIDNRSQYARQHIINNFTLPNALTNVTLKVLPAGAGEIQISTIIPANYPWTGTYFRGVPVVITAIPNPGYTFQKWSNNSYISNINNATFTANSFSTNTTTFTANFVPTASSVPKITISEVNYNSEPSIDSGDWIETWNYGNTPINISNWQIKDANDIHTYTFPLGTVIAPNSRLIIPNNIPKFKSQFPTVAYQTYLPFNLNNTTDQLRLIDDSNNLIQTTTYLDTDPWHPATDGLGRTLELKTPGSLISDPSNWFAGCIGGSPGNAYTACAENLIIDEINYKSLPNADASDWIELYNKTATDINISGWQFADISNNNRYTIPNATTIPANGYYVLFQDATKFNTLFPLVSNKTGPFSFGLDANGEGLRLFDNTGKLQFSMYYNSITPWPLEPNGQGKTLNVINTNENYNIGTNWFASCPEGSPGTAYIAAPAPATITTLNNTTFCEGNAIQLLATNTNGVSSYQWYNGVTSINNETNTSLTATQTGLYTVEVGNNGTCKTVSAPIAVDVIPLPNANIIVLNNNNQICPGNNAILQANEGIGYSYQWQQNNTNTGTNNYQLTTNNIGNYQVIVSNEYGCSATSNTQVITNATNCDIGVSIKAFLGGAFNGTNLNTNLTNLLPLQQPYFSTPWLYNGSELLSSVPTDMVDWVLVEAVDISLGTTAVVSRKAGILKNNGLIYNADNTFPLKMGNLNAGQNYYFVVRHRNHLAIMSNNAINVPNATTFDFTSNPQQAYGNGQQKLISNTAVMFPGDVNANGVMTVADFNLYGINPSDTNVYNIRDLNLDKYITVADFNLYNSNSSIIGIPYIRY